MRKLMAGTAVALESGERFKEHFAVPRNDSMINVGGSKIDIYGVRYRQIPPNAGLEEFVR